MLIIVLVERDSERTSTLINNKDNLQTGSGVWRSGSIMPHGAALTSVAPPPILKGRWNWNVVSLEGVDDSLHEHSCHRQSWATELPLTTGVPLLCSINSILIIISVAFTITHIVCKRNCMTSAYKTRIYE